MGRLIVLLGGARSGKSSAAEELAGMMAGAHGSVTYIATAQAFDAEMADRIAHHRRSRPAAWTTVEESDDLAGAVRATATDIVVIDCLTLWVSNQLLARANDVHVCEAVDSLLSACGAATSTIIMVSNEVGMGIVPAYPLGRQYRDLLGWVNARVSSAADDVVLMVAGLLLPLKRSGGAVCTLAELAVGEDMRQ